MATSRDSSAVYQNYIGGRWLPASSVETFDNRNPANTDDLIGRVPRSNACGCGSRRCRRARRVSTLAARARAEARGDPVPRRADSRRAQGGLRARHDARDGQDPRRDARRRAGSDRHELPDGGRRPAHVRPDRAVGAARQVRDVDAPADRRVRDDHRLELSDRGAVVEDPAGARLRQHGRVQAGRGSAASRPSTSCRRSPTPACPPAC